LIDFEKLEGKDLFKRISAFFNRYTPGAITHLDDALQKKI